MAQRTWNLKPTNQRKKKKDSEGKAKNEFDRKNYEEKCKMEYFLDDLQLQQCLLLFSLMSLHCIHFTAHEAIVVLILYLK